MTLKVVFATQHILKCFITEIYHKVEYSGGHSIRSRSALLFIVAILSVASHCENWEGGVG